MATLKDTSALGSLNEKDYINKLYDKNTDTTKQLLQEHYTDNGSVLNNESQRVQNQTNDYVKQTLVEAKKAQTVNNGPRLSQGATQQAALSRGNAQQANVTSLHQQRTEAEQELDRQRQLLGSQYAAKIKKAQADGDMERAQQLYEAARQEEAQLTEYRKSISSLLAEKGDTSVQDALLQGETPSADYSGQTWDQVLKHEDTINQVYDNKMESERLGLQMEQEKSLSDLEAKQRQQQAATDQDLTQAYVDAMKKAKNYAEVQNAYGQGSGTFAQAQLAQDTELQREMTRLRTLQMGRDAEIGLDRFGVGQDIRNRLVQAKKNIDSDRAGALIDAAENEEQTLVGIQQQIGQVLAKQNDYSVLGKLYGLTPDQIDRIQGTGAYAPKPVYYGGGYGGNGGRVDVIMQAAQDAKNDGVERAIANAVKVVNNTDAAKLRSGQ